MSSSTERSRARAMADVAAGAIHASVEIAVPPERVFAALASREIIDWWVRPGVFDTKDWTGDVRVGGRWRTTGTARGEPYVLEGEYLEVDPPRKLTFTWHRVGAPDAPTTVTFTLEPLGTGTRIVLRHSGFSAPEACSNVAVGWETAFLRLVEILEA
jgi:uncharacterized protein YndB with AHSA1/START domain